MKRYISLFLVLFFVISSCPIVQADTINSTVDRQKLKDLVYQYIPTKTYKNLLDQIGVSEDNDNLRSFVANKIGLNKVLNFSDEKITLCVDNFINTLTVSEVETLNTWDISNFADNDGTLYYTQGQNSVLDRLLYSVFNGILGNAIYPDEEYSPPAVMSSMTFTNFWQTYMGSFINCINYGNFYPTLSSLSGTKNIYATKFTTNEILTTTGVVETVSTYWMFSTHPISVVYNGQNVVATSLNSTYKCLFRARPQKGEYIATDYFGIEPNYYRKLTGSVESNFLLTANPTPVVDYTELNNKIDIIIKKLFEENPVNDDPISIPVPTSTSFPVGSDTVPTVEQIQNIINNYYTYTNVINITPKPVILDPTDTNSILVSIFKSIQDGFKSIKDFWIIDFNVVSASSSIETILEEKFGLFYIINNSFTTVRNLTIEQNPPVITFTVPSNVIIFGDMVFTVFDLTAYPVQLQLCKTLLSGSLWLAFALGVWDYFNPKLVIS